MNTYAAVNAGAYNFRTRSFVNSGKLPLWDEVFEFPLTAERFVNFSICDAGSVTDSLIGQAVFDLEEICGRVLNRFCDFLLLTHKGRAVGELYVTIAYYENPWYNQQVQAHMLQQEQNLRCNF